MHLVADLEPVEVAVDQAVAVKIQLAAFMRQDEAVILVGIKLRHLAGEGLACTFTSPRCLRL